jgi:hypothetical protein
MSHVNPFGKCGKFDTFLRIKIYVLKSIPGAYPRTVFKILPHPHEGVRALKMPQDLVTGCSQLFFPQGYGTNRKKIQSQGALCE